MSDLRRLKLMIISTAFVLMSSVPISTVYSDIMLEFSDSPGWLLDFMTVALGPMSVAAMAVSGLLHRVMGTKGLATCSLLLILVTGVLPILGGGIVTVIFARCSVGFACGLLSPTVTTLSAQHFEGAEKEKIMGYRNASQAFGSMSMMAITMLLANAGWRWAFSIYLLVLPSLFIVLFVMPGGIAADGQATTEEPEGEEGSIPSLPVLRVAFYAGISFLYLACLNTLAPSLSSFLVQEGIAVGTMSGIGMIAYMTGSFFAGMTYKLSAAVCGGFTVLAGMLVTVAGIAAIGLTNKFSVVVIGCFLQGVGAAVFNAASMIDVTHRGSRRWMPRAIRVVMVFTSMGSFLSPFLADWGAGLLLGTVSMRNRYRVAAAVLLVFSIVTLFYRLYRSRIERKISISQ